MLSNNGASSTRCFTELTLWDNLSFEQLTINALLYCSSKIMVRGSWYNIDTLIRPSRLSLANRKNAIIKGMDTVSKCHCKHRSHCFWYGLRITCKISHRSELNLVTVCSVHCLLWNNTLYVLQMFSTVGCSETVTSCRSSTGNRTQNRGINCCCFRHCKHCGENGSPYSQSYLTCSAALTESCVPSYGSPVRVEDCLFGFFYLFDWTGYNIEILIYILCYGKLCLTGRFVEWYSFEKTCHICDECREARERCHDWNEHKRNRLCFWSKHEWS